MSVALGGNTYLLEILKHRPVTRETLHQLLEHQNCDTLDNL